MKQDTTGNIWFYRNVPPGTPEGNAVSGNSAMSPDGTLVSFCLRVRFIAPQLFCPRGMLSWLGSRASRASLEEDV